VHVFQRRRLVRHWREDFPAIHSEGGLPGSKSAGIVAFLRERLVDLGEEALETESEQPDLEAQTSKVDPVDSADQISVPHVRAFRHSKTNSSSRVLEPGYILDEIPLLDVDIRHDEVVHNANSVG
jgi:hypothetical protein